jgi:hypothetical protein
METRQQEQSNRLNNGQIQWMRRVLTIFVGIPTALKLLSYEWGMFGLATLLCSLCMIEFSSTICNEILGLKRKNIFLYRSHTILMVFCGIFVCTITAFGKRKLYHDAALLCVNLILVFYHLIQAERIDHKGIYCT